MNQTLISIYHPVELPFISTTRQSAKSNIKQMSLVVKRGGKAISLLSYRAPSILQFGNRRWVTFKSRSLICQSSHSKKVGAFPRKLRKAAQKQLSYADKTANPVPIKHRIHHTPKINLDDSARGAKKKRRIYLLEVRRKHSAKLYVWL